MEEPGNFNFPELKTVQFKINTLTSKELLSSDVKPKMKVNTNLNFKNHETTKHI